MDLTLAAGDRIKAMLDTPVGGDQVDDNESQGIIAKFKNLLLQTGEKEEKEKKEEIPTAQQPTPQPSSPREIITYRIRFQPSQDIFTRGTNPLHLLDQLRQLGDCKPTAHIDDIPLLEDCNPDFCYISWDIILTTDKGINAIRDVFIFIEGDGDLKIEAIGEDEKITEETKPKKIGDILIERGDLKADDLKGVLESQKQTGEMLVEAGVVEPSKVESALVEQRYVREVMDKRKKAELVSSVRVASDKLDVLVDLVGELVTVQARLSQTASGETNSDLLLISEEVERLTAELRDNTMSIRMLPIGTTFSRFKRLVRDLAGELGKETELTTSGGETELDKTVIERLNDPLIHLIRNGVDHGIESPDTRKAAGKPSKGRIHLSATHSGASVLIKIKDDGLGLDPEVIRAKAVEKGMIAPDSDLTKKEIFGLIFAPGFSTAKNVTNVSGRGVGMDVVKRSMDDLRGSIDIESHRGKGSEITLRLPLTLAIIEGLLVKIKGDFFVLPLSYVEECVELTTEDVAASHGHRIANVRGEIIPYIKLRDFFSMNGNRPPIEQIVITELDGRKIGFVVDEVIGGHQTVIKSLGTTYKDVEFFTGATILGDGTVALILDIAKLAQFMEGEESLVRNEE